MVDDADVPPAGHFLRAGRLTMQLRRELLAIQEGEPPMSTGGDTRSAWTARVMTRQACSLRSRARRAFPALSCSRDIRRAVPSRQRLTTSSARSSALRQKARSS